MGGMCDDALEMACDSARVMGFPRMPDDWGVVIAPQELAGRRTP